MGKLQFGVNKTLKLQNVLTGEIDLENQDIDFTIMVERMQSYIKVKGAVQIGPLIQHTRTFVNEDGELDMKIILMLQCNHFINSVEKPYSMESILRVTDCMYCRYIGLEEKLKIAYDKIGVEAFEKDIELSEESYTVFVNSNEEEGTITADIFIPKNNS
ncbi:MAG: hypothetical protein HFI77_01665 [Lachnospiraceae bacterium]|jgi:hypothetical protein|nr:hypothetical protein [Lachnospiraceae bacterium]MDE6904627.1 hypothetical protein [Lachnospiraceae bacterium]